MFHSATLKLTLWYMAMVMAISLAFSGAVYHFATNTLATGLSDQQSRIYKAFPVFDNDPFFVRKDDLKQGSRHILYTLIYLNLLVLVGGGFISYALARRTLRPIEQAHEQQKRFTSDVSHELRTPLTSLKMESEVALLDKNLPKDKLRSTISSNLEEASKLENLVNNLLKLTTLEAHHLNEHFGEVTTKDIISKAVDYTSHSAKVKNIKIQVKKTSDLKITGDKDSLIQLLIILIDNAIKYSPSKSSITINARQHNKRVFISVHDQGVGIDAKDLPHIFDRFYRADASRAKDTDGSNGYGLGLSIAKLISDLHSGNITLSSKKNKGTTATVELPKFNM